jgi:hypothetical protein
VGRRKLPYKKGTWILVPLRTQGYALGLVARMDGKGRIFGYFFGPVISEPSAATIPNNLKPEDAILSGRFGDLGLINGEWIVLGEKDDWNKDEWKMPPFVRVDEHSGKAFVSVYDDNTLNFVSEKPCNPALVDKYPHDIGMGYGSVEIQLTKLLNPKAE